MGWEQNRTAARPYYVKKYRLGEKVFTTYMGFGEAAIEISKLDGLLLRAKTLERESVNDLLRSLVSLHAANEAQFVSTENELVLALHAAGFHRPFRGLWRKRRVTANTLRSTDGTTTEYLLHDSDLQHSTTISTRNTSANQDELPIAVLPNAQRSTPNAACGFDLLASLEPRLIGRIDACRKHCANIHAITVSMPKATLTYNDKQLLDRCSARAHKRVLAAEASLELLNNLAMRLG